MKYNTNDLVNDEFKIIEKVAVAGKIERNLDNLKHNCIVVDYHLKKIQRLLNIEGENNEQ